MVLPNILMAPTLSVVAHTPHLQSYNDDEAKASFPEIALEVVFSEYDLRE